MLLQVDLDQRFHVIAVALSSYETKEAYQGTLDACKAAVDNFLGVELPEVKFGMSDGAQQIGDAAMEVFSGIKWGNCYAHVMVRWLLTCCCNLA